MKNIIIANNILYIKEQNIGKVWINFNNKIKAIKIILTKIK
jgi:hypothetical protein